MQQEKLLKMQAVNKLAEIMNRKDMNISNKKQKQSTSADLRKKEKECRKLQQDLNLVRVSPLFYAFVTQTHFFPLIIPQI